MPKVLLITTDLSTGGGVTRVISNLSHVFSGLNGLEIHVLHATPVERFRYGMHSSVRLIEGRRYVGNNALNLLLNLVQLRRRGYDFAVSFWTHENILACLAFLFSSCRLIVCEHLSHDQASPLLSRARRWVYRLAACIAVLNDDERRHYSSFHPHVVLLPNPVIRESTPVDYAEKQDLIIGVGHLSRRKGFEYLVQACVAARIADHGWRAVIIGNGAERSALEALIHANGAEGVIQILPETEAIDDWYKAAKLIVVPSTTEVFSMALAEAMGYGVVPLAFRTSGPCQILKRFPDHLIPVGDVVALSMALRKSIESSELPGRAEVLRQEAFDRYSFATLATEWRKLLLADSSS